MTQLNLRSAFLHVIDGHRWLAASARTWNVVGPHVTGQAKENIHRLLPNIDVTALDSVLMRARLLIKFYRNVSQRDNDILLGDFRLAPSMEARFQPRKICRSNRYKTNQNQSTRSLRKRLKRHNIIRNFQNGAKGQAEL